MSRETLEQAFWRRVAVSDGCWLWTGNLDKDGYGVFILSRRQRRAHVVSLELSGRPVPRGMYGCHRCDNPSCVNPAHLYVGTPKQNVADAVSRGRLNLQRNAKLNAAQVIAIRSAAGTHEAIAAEYGVARATVSLIKERRTWGHIP